VHIGVYSEPKPKGVSSLELLKHLLWELLKKKIYDDCIESFSFHEQNQFFWVFLLKVISQKMEKAIKTSAKV
jgi:hypothetical protein